MLPMVTFPDEIDRMRELFREEAESSAAAPCFTGCRRSA